jgi:hypothetical protein
MVRLRTCDGDGEPLTAFAAIGDATLPTRTRAVADGLGRAIEPDTCRIRKTPMGEALTRVSKALTAAGASIEADMPRSKPNQSVGFRP